MARTTGRAAEALWPSAAHRAGLSSDWPDRVLALIAASALLTAAGPLLMSTPDDAASTKRHVPSTEVADLAHPPETIVAGYGGITATHPSDVRFANPGVTDLTVHGVNWDGRPFKSPIYYGLRAIRWPATSRFGGMVDFTHAKTISQREQAVPFSGTRNGRPTDATAKIGDTFRHLEFSHGHNMLTLNGLMRLGQLTPRLQPYVGGGLGVSLPHTEVQFLDETKRTYEYQIAGAAVQVLGGIELRLARASVFVEYKFSFAPYSVPLSGLDGGKGNAFVDYAGQIGRWWRGEAPLFGVLTTRLATHHVIAGVGARMTGATPPPSVR